MFIYVVKNNDEIILFMLYLSRIGILFDFQLFFIYTIYSRGLIFVLVKAENLSEGFSQGDCLSRDSCTRSQDIDECVSNSVAEAMITEIKDMYHPTSYF